jgi:hypothetical protein
LAAVRSATESCCPGAYDHLMGNRKPAHGKGRDAAGMEK